MNSSNLKVPAEFANRRIYHFTHIKNLPDILRNGLRAKNLIGDAIAVHSIAASGIQTRRSSMQVPCGIGGTVHDYVPLYFGSLSPMLLSVIRTKNFDQYDIIYFEFPITIMERLPCVFTDASANTAVPPNFYEDLDNLSQLDWAEIDSKKWGSATDQARHRRMAEVLVHGTLPLAHANCVVVWSKSVMDRVKLISEEAQEACPPIDFEHPERTHYFCDFMNNGSELSSLVAGPGETYESYLQCCEDLKGMTSEIKKGVRYDDLIEGLRRNFSRLPYTGELVGLYSSEHERKDCMGTHTKQVVDNVLSHPSFEALGDRDQVCLLLSAYLHDIGKGPKSRWQKTDGKYRIDQNHPIRALPLLLDMHKNFVNDWEIGEAQLLAKLVCYHDLVGDILAKGRDREQLLSVADSPRELDMLFILAEADVKAVPALYWDAFKANQLYKWALARLEHSDD